MEDSRRATYGWTQTHSSVSTSSGSGYYDAFSHPPHNGTYSVKIGTATNPGMISQSVTIPSKSSAKFTAWYRLEKGSSLSISLKAADGSLIKQWPFSATVGVPVWTQVTYSLDVTYAGQSVTIEIDGVGYEETVTGPCFIEMSGFEYCYSSYNDYYSFVDDISMVASVVQYAAQVSIADLPQDLSATIYVDGQPQSGKINGGQNQTLAFPLGSSHTISVDPYVSRDNKTRYYCAQPSATVTSDQSVAFDYRTQYYLFVNSLFGSISGNGWYDEGSKASISINQNWFLMQGLVGALGARYVFQKWTGDVSGSSTTLQVIVDRPKSVSAIWVPDYSIFYVAIAVLVAGVAFVSWILIRRHRKVGKRGTEIFLEDRPWVESEKTQIETPQKQKTEIFKEKEKSENKKE